MEKSFLFGEKKNLLGILSEPNVPRGHETKPLILILNSGFVHRPGPFRMNKEFSMFLASQGYPSFRFDLSGVGDSEKQAMDSMVYKDRNLSDIGEAIMFLKESIKPPQIIVMGLCTGADLAHQAAVKYDDISGSILLDGYGYPSPLFYVKRYGPILLSPKRIFGVLTTIASKLLHKTDSSEPEESGADGYYWVLPKKQDYIADMEKLHQAGKKHFYGYTAGVAEYYNYEQQFEDSFKSHAFINDVQVSYFKYSDHTFILLNQRKLLFDSIMKWIKSI